MHIIFFPVKDVVRWDPHGKDVPRLIGHDPVQKTHRKKLMPYINSRQNPPPHTIELKVVTREGARVPTKQFLTSKFHPYSHSSSPTRARLTQRIFSATKKIGVMHCLPKTRLVLLMTWYQCQQKIHETGRIGQCNAIVKGLAEDHG